MYDSFIHFRYLYSTPSRFLLRGAPDYSADTESEFHAEEHEQLRVKDLPRVPTRRLEVDSNPQPFGCKAPNMPLHHRAPIILVYYFKLTHRIMITIHCMNRCSQVITGVEFNCFSSHARRPSRPI